MRKQDVILGLFLLLALASCHGPRREARQMPTAAPGLAAIDSLSWAQPDSALALLLPWFDTRRADTAPDASDTTLNRHYANLLLAELLYKNDYAQTNRDEVQQAVDYFDSLTMALADNAPPRNRHGGPAPPSPDQAASLAFLAARAHYINGVGHYEQESVEEACNEYINALETMERRFDERELVEKRARFMALAYIRLADLYSNSFLPEQTIYFGKSALDYYDRYDASGWHKAWIMNKIGTQFEMVGKTDSAAFFYYKATEALGDTNNTLYRDIATNKACLSYKTGNAPQDALRRLHGLLFQAKDDMEIQARRLSIGYIYYSERQLDSASLCLGLVFHHSSSLASKRQAAEWLYEICKAQGKEGEALEYAGFLAPFANQSENQGHRKSQLTRLCQGYEQDRMELAHQKKVRRLARLAGMTVAALAVAAFALAFVHLIHKRRGRRQEMRNGNRLDELYRQMQAERDAYATQQKALSGRLRQSNESLRAHMEENEQLRKSLQIHQSRAKWGTTDDLQREIICTEIIGAFHGKSVKREAKAGDYPEMELSASQSSRLDTAVETHFPGFSKVLADLYPRINANEIKQCQLYLLNLEDVQIAHLLSCDYSTVKKRARKLKAAFNTEKEPRQFVRELVL